MHRIDGALPRAVRTTHELTQSLRLDCMIRVEPSSSPLPGLNPERATTEGAAKFGRERHRIHFFEQTGRKFRVPQSTDTADARAHSRVRDSKQARTTVIRPGIERDPLHPHTGRGEIDRLGPGDRTSAFRVLGPSSDSGDRDVRQWRSALRARARAFEHPVPHGRYRLREGWCRGLENDAQC